MKKTSKSRLILVTLIFFLFFYIFHTSFMISNVLDYTQLFLMKLFPVSFPLFILSSLLLEYHFFDYLPFHSLYLSVFLLSFISGFPSGANYTKKLLDNRLISVFEGNQILQFSHFPNPLFVLGTVSMTIGNSYYGLWILLSIFFSNFMILLFFHNKKEKESISFHQEPVFSKAFQDAILSSCKTMVLIYGISLSFYLFSIFLLKYLSISPYVTVFVSGFFDLTKGVTSTILFSSKYLRALFILFFISFGGISIHMQIKSILADTNLSYLSYVKGRFIGTILAFFIFFLATYFYRGV